MEDDDRAPSNFKSIQEDIIFKTEKGKNMRAQMVNPIDDKPKPKAAFNNPNYRTKVCIHWLQNKCSKGDNCEFLHEKALDKMPECPKGTKCTSKDCLFKHTENKIEKLKECPFYQKGYCKKGDECKLEHVFTPICPDYSYGFCPDGPKCQKGAHPKSLISESDDNIFNLATLFYPLHLITRPDDLSICHKCGGIGHVFGKCYGLKFEPKQ